MHNQHQYNQTNELNRIEQGEFMFNYQDNRMNNGINSQNNQIIQLQPYQYQNTHLNYHSGYINDSTTIYQLPHDPYVQNIPHINYPDHPSHFNSFQPHIPINNTLQFNQINYPNNYTPNNHLHIQSGPIYPQSLPISSLDSTHINQNPIHINQTNYFPNQNTHNTYNGNIFEQGDQRYPQSIIMIKKQHSNMTQSHEFMGNLYNDNYQTTLKQQPPIVVHFDASQQKDQQKNHVQTLLDEIHALNKDLQKYHQQIKELQNRKQTNPQYLQQGNNTNYQYQYEKISIISNNDQLIQRVTLMTQVIKQNYKIISKKPTKSDQKQEDKDKQPHEKAKNNQTNFNQFQLIDMTQEWKKLIDIHRFYCGTDQNQEKHHSSIQSQEQSEKCTIKEETNTMWQRCEYEKERTQQRFSNYSRNQYYHQQNDDKQTEKQTNQINLCKQQDKFNTMHAFSVFIELILEISQFRHITYMISNLNRAYLNNYLIESNDSLPLMTTDISLPLIVTDILSHIQSIQLLHQSYEHELNKKQYLKEEQDNILGRIQTKWIQLWVEIQQLMADFLQKIMLSPQHTDIGNESQNVHTDQNKQNLWFFYYEYPQFNKHWITFMLQTLIQTQMLDRANPNALQQRNQNFNSSQNKSTSKTLKNNKGKLFQNTKNKTHKVKASINSNRKSISPQVQNNLLSIFCFLLYPNASGNKPSHQQNNPIIPLLEKPIKQLISQQIKGYLKSTKSSDLDHCSWVSPFLILQKVTSVISFYASKLVSSNKSLELKTKENQTQSTNYSTYKSNPSTSQPHNQQSEIPNPQSEQINQNSQFCLQIKLMELTLFARQMADIVILSSKLGESQKNENESEKNQQKLSVQSVVDSLFEKIGLRKKQQA